MRRLPQVVLTIVFLALGSGALGHIHNLDHQNEHEHAAGEPHPVPDESNCDLHAQLHLPLLTGGWVPLLVCLGLLVAFLSLLNSPLTSRQLLLQLDCRGPPAC